MTDTVLTELRADLREIRQQRDRDFRWILGVMLGGFALSLSAIGGLGLAVLPALHAVKG